MLADAIARIESYLDGRALQSHLDPEDIHGVWVKREDNSRDLRVSDLKTLLNAIKEA